MTAVYTQEAIAEHLELLEREEGIRILYACESGSRAWGFPSRDSDYDVRFLYIRRPEWYLSIFDRRDVIERPEATIGSICRGSGCGSRNTSTYSVRCWLATGSSADAKLDERLDGLFRETLREAWELY